MKNVLFFLSFFFLLQLCVLSDFKCLLSVTPSGWAWPLWDKLRGALSGVDNPESWWADPSLAPPCWPASRGGWTDMTPGSRAQMVGVLPKPWALRT